MSSYGRLTVKGSKEFDEKLGKVLDDISLDIKTLISEDLYEAVILIGGYGRGEGGVVKVENREYPHNNFDFIVVSKNITKDEEVLLSDMCKSIFDKHTESLGIFVEFTVISASKLLNIDPLVITYDMKYGHKVIAGNSDCLTKNTNFEVETIPSWDIRNLIVNRGTLLIINDLILEKENLVYKDKKTVIKHWVKAIIGYGDALLFYLGKYHYSYVEKQKRMKALNNIDPKFKALYDKAMEFRFQPNYERYDKFNINKYHQFLKAELTKIHFLCESLALDNVEINSKTYITKAINQSLIDTSTLKGNIKKILFLVKKAPKISGFNFVEDLKYKMLGVKGMMPILFPFIAYGIKGKEFDGIVRDFFQTNNDDKNLKNQYLTYWKNHVNSNFIREDFGI